MFSREKPISTLDRFIKHWIFSYYCEKLSVKLQNCVAKIYDQLEIINLTYKEKLSAIQYLHRINAGCLLIKKNNMYWLSELLYDWLNKQYKTILYKYGHPNLSYLLTYLNITLPDSTYWNIVNQSFRPISITDQQTIKEEPLVVPHRPALTGLKNSLTCALLEIGQYRIVGLFSFDPFKHLRHQLSCPIEIEDIREKEILDIYSLRDRMIWDGKQLAIFVKRDLEKITTYKEIGYDALKTEYNFLPPALRYKLISLLVFGKMELFAQQLLTYYNESLELLEISDWEVRHKIGIPKISITIENKPKKSTSYEAKIAALNANDKTKTRAYDMLNIIRKSSDAAPKAQQYLDRLLCIPFGEYKEEKALCNPINEIQVEFQKAHPNLDMSEFITNLKIHAPELETKLIGKQKEQVVYLEQVEEILNQSVHGHEEAKIQMKRLVAQWMRGEQTGMIIGLQGPPGNGKTTLIKNGLAQCLKDEDGVPRPVGFISLGGASSGSSLEGHSYTYQGSKCGRIAEILMDSGCMNPIILMDELDKVSKTERGREIIGILTHLTDSTQNKDFNDRYFDGVSLDISKSIIIFTFNDLNAVDRVLRDRLTIIKTKPLTVTDKLIVARNHLLPELAKSIGTKQEINISDETLRHLIREYTAEAGARQLKQLLRDLVRELNLRDIMEPTRILDQKLEITPELITDIFRYKDRAEHKKIPDNDIVGQINGMYANTLGMGGILPIQVSKTKSDTLLKMELTGSQGDVMKESMSCAKTVAWSLLDEETRRNVEKQDTFGIHIHCPAASTPKDGPSAGGAICLAMLSMLSGKKLRKDVAMTGELDLRGNVTAIGGLDAKLSGAKAAGVKIAIIPKDNHRHLEHLREQDLSPEDDNFVVHEVSRIEEAENLFF